MGGGQGGRRKANNPIKEIKKVVRIVKNPPPIWDNRQVRLVHFHLNVDPSLVSGEGALDNTGF